MHYYSNVLVSKGYSINKEFEDYINILMNEYGNVKSGPIKNIERIKSKLENDYNSELFPRSAKILYVIQ